MMNPNANQDPSFQQGSMNQNGAPPGFISQQNYAQMNGGNSDGGQNIPMMRQMNSPDGDFQNNRGGGFQQGGYGGQNNYGGGGMNHYGGGGGGNFGGSDNNEKFKTALCNNFSQTEFCKFGDTCKFAHGDDELRSGGGGGGQRGGGFQPRGRGGFGGGGQRGGGFGDQRGGYGGQRGGGYGGQRGGGYGMRGGFGGDGGMDMQGGMGMGGGMNRQFNMNPGFGGQGMGRPQICKFFQQNGECKFEANCKFVHDGSDDN